MKDPNEFFNKYPKDPDIFNFDKLQARPLYTIIPYEAELEFYKIATTLSLNSDLQKKYQLIDDLARRLDLTFLARGTNRSVYTVNYDSSIIIKIGYDKAGITDSKREFENQQFIKPFCTKCFEVSPTGTVGLFERVTPIKHLEEFKSMAADIFDMLYKKILGRYIMADIGMDQYMNYGFREGFGPVILDYPYMYEVDESKLKCRNVSIATGEVCTGTIDYDDTFDHLVCNTCGKVYNARDLAKEIQHQKDRELYKGLMEESTMKIKSYGENASFDSEKGGKIEAKVETIALPSPKPEEQPTQTDSSKKNDSIEFLPKDEVQKLIQNAYLSGMVEGKNKAEQQQQSRRTFNPTGETPKPQEQPKVQPAQPVPQQNPQPVVKEPEQPKPKTVVIEEDNYVPYRDPTPKGKGGSSNYRGWQTPRNTGRPLHIRQDSPKQQGQQNRDNQQGQQQSKQQQQGQQRPTPQQNQKPQQQGIPQPKPNAPKPREPYQPKQPSQRIFDPKQSSQPASDPKQRITNASDLDRAYEDKFRGLPKQPTQTPPKKEQRPTEPSQSNEQPPKQTPYMNLNDAFKYQPMPPIRDYASYMQSHNLLVNPYTPQQASNSYDSVVANKIMKHVILFCVENAERRDDVIYELTYITTLYHIELDPRFDVPMKNITDVVRKIVDLVEDKLENSGIKIEYEYDDDDRYKPQDPNDIPGGGSAFLNGDLKPITDDQEDRLSYNDRIHNSGISFREDLVPIKPNDQISEEVGTIFNTNSEQQIQHVAEYLQSNNADPNDISVKTELTQRIGSQLSK